MFDIPTQAIYDRVQREHRLHVPVTFATGVTAADVQLDAYGFDRPIAAGSVFRDHCTISAASTATPPQLRAVYAGALRFVPPASTALGGTLILALGDPFVTQAYRHLRPRWLPVPRITIYSNVDPPSLFNDLLDIGAREDVMADARQWWIDSGLTVPDSWGDCLNMFMAGTDPRVYLPVRAGWNLGSAGERAGRWRVDIKMIEGDAETRTLNPSWCFARSRPIVTGLAGHLLEGPLATPTWGPCSTGSFQFVRSGGGSSGPFTTPATPAASVAVALAAAAANDTIVILDNAVYGDALVIDKPITITGVAEIDPCETGASLAALPKLDGGGSHRVIRVHWPSPAADDGFSMVCLRGLAIRNGHVLDAVGSSQFEGGGGVTLRETHRVVIERCAITDNESLWVSPTTINIFSRLSSNAQTAISATEPELETRLRHVKDFGLAGQGFGGGVNCLSSSAYLLGNLIADNVARCRGGGIGVAGYGWPVIEANVVRDNRSTHGSGEGRPDGGGIGITVAIPSEKPLSLCISDMTDDLVSWENGLSITERLSLITVLGDGLGLIRAFLTPHRASYWSVPRITSARTQYAVLLDNRITGNRADDDGGGLYLSVMSAAFLRNNRFEDNECRTGSAGGVRLTMASQIWSSGDRVMNNRGFIATGSAVNDGSGGGGIASRNSELKLADNTEVADNVVRGWAGGGLFFTSSGEGGTENLFHVILIDIFEFRQSVLQIASGCQVRNNQTVDLTGQGHHAKGGGIYALRWNGEAANGDEVLEQDDVPTIRLEVAAGAVTGNRATLDAGSPAGEGRDNFYLVDQSNGSEASDADYSGAVGSYRYP